MSYNSVVADFQLILNRTDCSDDQARVFVNQGIARIERDCRLPSMERSLAINCVGSTDFFTIPKDMLQPIDVIWIDASGQSHALEKTSYRELVKLRGATGLPTNYARLQSQFWIAGSAPADTILQFFYYGNFTPFEDPDSDNELTAGSPDLAVYAALSYAGEDFEHPSTDRWEARYQAIKSEVQGMAIDADAEGGPQAVQPTYWD